MGERGNAYDPLLVAALVHAEVGLLAPPYGTRESPRIAEPQEPPRATKHDYAAEFRADDKRERKRRARLAAWQGRR